MSHFNQIKSLIHPYKETKVFPKFLHWLLSDPKYGSVNQTNDKKSIKAIQGVIDLYKEWIDTGIKPDKKLWRKARDLAAVVAAAYAADDAAAAAAADDAYAADYAAVACAADDAAADDAVFAAVAAGIPRSEVKQAQLDKLSELINEYHTTGFSKKDETPNQVVEFLINTLKSFGYSAIKTEELNKLKSLETKVKELV